MWSAFVGSFSFGFINYITGIFSVVDIAWITAAIITISGAVVTTVVTSLKLLGPSIAEYRTKQLEVDRASAQGVIAMKEAELASSHQVIENSSRTVEVLLKQIEGLNSQLRMLTIQIEFMHKNMELKGVHHESDHKLLINIESMGLPRKNQESLPVPVTPVEL